MKRHLWRALIVLVLLPFIRANAQLSDKEIDILAQKVRMNYDLLGLSDGARVYQTPKHWALVSLVTVSSEFKPSQQNRQAQVEVTRTAIEFLKGASNKSISVYDASSTEGHVLVDEANSHVNQNGPYINSGVSTNLDEKTISTDSETISDKIVQSSLENMDRLQPLIKFKGEEGIVYAYFMVIGKHTAKKKK